MRKGKNNAPGDGRTIKELIQDLSALYFANNDCLQGFGKNITNVNALKSLLHLHLLRNMVNIFCMETIGFWHSIQVAFLNYETNIGRLFENATDCIIFFLKGLS